MVHGTTPAEDAPLCARLQYTDGGEQLALPDNLFRRPVPTPQAVLRLAVSLGQDSGHLVDPEKSIAQTHIPERVRRI